MQGPEHNIGERTGIITRNVGIGLFVLGVAAPIAAELIVPTIILVGGGEVLR